MSETRVKRETPWTVVVLVFGLTQTGIDYEQGHRHCREWGLTLVA